MMTKPFFSIITVTKNNLLGVKKTGQSLQQQTCTDYQWIVIDGASIDGTQNYLASRQVEWLSEKDKGLYEAMNKGLIRALGEYTIFLNAGDDLADEYTLKQIKEGATNFPDFIYGDAWEGGFYKRARSERSINTGMITHHQAMVYKTALLKLFRFNLTYKIAADFDLTWRFLRKAQTDFYLPMPLCRFEPGGLSQQQQQTGRIEEYMIRRRAGMTGFSAQWIYTRQAATSLLKETAPPAYWALRRYISTAR